MDVQRFCTALLISSTRCRKGWRTPHQLLNIAIGLVTTALSALVGAWLGARIALSRFKREKAFDRRLEWLVRALRTVHHLDEACRRAHLADNPAVLADAELARRHFKRMVAEAPAYLPSRPARSIRLSDLELSHAQFITHKLMADGEDEEVVSQGRGQELGFIAEAEKEVLAAIHRLMPLEPEFTARQRLGGRVRRLLRLARAPRRTRANTAA